jgi:Fe2+ or Zn2+ uptake regulation protein
MSGTGGRVTEQRALILEIIKRGGSHLDADEIYRRARLEKPRLSLSTVYRTLQALKHIGLIDEIHLDDSHHHYEIKPRAEHHHLICLGCGRVIEFRYPLTSHVQAKVAEAREFEITGAEVRLTGYCAQCRQERARRTDQGEET